MKQKKALRTLILLISASIINASPIFQNEHSQWSQILSSSPIGQTFTAEDNYINFGFFVGDGNSSSGLNDYSIDFLLYEGTGVNGSLLSTKQFTGLYNDYLDYAVVDFSDVNLSIGSSYTVIVSNNNQRWGVYLRDRDLYNGGSLIMGGSPLGFCDATFRVDPISNSVPEPGIFSLIGIGFLSVMLTRRKKQYFNYM